MSSTASTISAKTNKPISNNSAMTPVNITPIIAAKRLGARSVGLFLILNSDINPPAIKLSGLYLFKLNVRKPKSTNIKIAMPQFNCAKQMIASSSTKTLPYAPCSH